MIWYEMRKYKKGNVMIESMSIIYIKIVLIEFIIEVYYEMLDVGWYFVKLEVIMINNGEKVVNVLVIC